MSAPAMLSAPAVRVEGNLPGLDAYRHFLAQKTSVAEGAAFLRPVRSPPATQAPPARHRRLGRTRWASRHLRRPSDWADHDAA